jgi:hypothetical protein
MLRADDPKTRKILDFGNFLDVIHSDDHGLIVGYNWIMIEIILGL